MKYQRGIFLWAFTLVWLSMFGGLALWDHYYHKQEQTDGGQK